MVNHSSLLFTDDDYKQWRNKKLNRVSQLLDNEIGSLFVDIPQPDELSPQVKQQILKHCQQNNYCLYKLSNNRADTKNNIHLMAKQLGLVNLDTNLCADTDSLTSITMTTHKGQHDYIPYSNKKLSWHTDGYYNSPSKQVHSILLHCAQPAKEGGESYLMDHEIAYILLRDENPDYIRALTKKDAMTIPANILNGKVIRPAQTGPVFSLNSNGGIHMRYSARKRNIEWKQNNSTLEAVAFLENILNSDNQFIIKYKFKAGEGIICKNILHRRTSFVDFDDPTKKRLLYRGRYFDQVLSN